MKFPKELTTITKLSKYLAMVVFIALPFVGFFLGVRYQEMSDLAKRQEMEANLSILRIPTPTPDETISWKTCQSKRAPFLFKYPSDWPFAIASDQDLKIFQNQYIEAMQFDKTFYWNASDIPLGYIYVQNQTEIKTIQEYLQKIDREYEQLPAEIKKIESKPQIEYTKLAGVDAIIIIDKASVYSFDSGSTKYVLFKNNLQYTLVLQDTSKKPIFDQILSTFQFTNQ
jgi:hypothetical protein